MGQPNNTSDFYNRLLNQNWYLSLSELDVAWDCHYAVSSGASLAAIHSLGFTHGDFHAGNLFYTPVTGYGGVVDRETLEENELAAERAFGELIPAFLTMTPEFFIAFLIGYFKSAAVLLDNQKPGFSQEVLALVTLNSRVLVDEIDVGYQISDMRDRITFRLDKNQVAIEENPRIGLGGYDSFVLRWSLTVLRATGMIKVDRAIKIDAREMSAYVELRGIAIPKDTIEKLVVSFSSRNKLGYEEIVRMFNDWISLLKDAIGNEQLHFWAELIASLDTISQIFDEECKTHDSDWNLYQASIVSAFLSLLLLRNLSDISEEIRSFEQFELSVRKQQSRLSWQVTPNHQEWKGIPYVMRAINFEEPAEVLAEELSRHEFAEKNWQYIPQRILGEFQYYDEYIKLLNSLLSQSGFMRRKGAVKNILWTCGYRAMAYARRNAFTMGRYILENKLQGETSILAYSTYLVALETMKITLLTYWAYVGEYYGDTIEGHIHEFDEEYQKFINELETISKVEEYLKKDKLFLFQGLRESIAIVQEVINRSDPFPL